MGFALDNVALGHVFLRAFRCFPVGIIPQMLLTHITRGTDKSLARPTSRCVLFDGENISFDAGAYAPARKLSTNLYGIYRC
jgi:hypothetical protein